MMNRYWFRCVVVLSWLVLVVSSSNIGGDRQDIGLSGDGGYTDLLIAISDRVPEDLNLLNKLKTYFVEASINLLGATKSMMYFKSITIIVPSGWTHNSSRMEPTTKETFKRARVLVAEPNLARGDVPYTLQPGGCGEEGDYIHLTPDYLTKDGASDRTHRPAKRIVREFAHLKWGLFDEDVPSSDKNSTRFYIKDNKHIPIGCTGEFSGKITDINTGGSCQADLTTGIYPGNCVFEPSSTSGDGSLMSFEYLDEVRAFCSGVGNTKHNSEAPNLQNAKCGKSAWAVMMDHDDFARNYSKRRGNKQPAAPFFKIVQEKIEPTTTVSTTTRTVVKRAVRSKTTSEKTASTCKQDIVCLCLDVSGSMDGIRVNTMSESVKVYILTHLRNNTAVGIVSFSDSAYVNADMTVITSDQIRRQLAYRVPTRANGGTDIGVGLNKCRHLLGGYTSSKHHTARIVLLGDGEGNLGSSVERIVQEGITIDTILYGQGARLVGIAQQTGGTEFFASDYSGDVDMAQFFSETASRGCEESNAVLINKKIVIPPGQKTYNLTVAFDNTIGMDTKMMFKYSHTIGLVVAIARSNHVDVKRDSGLSLLTAVVQGQVNGNTDCMLTKRVDIGIEVTVLVTVTSAPIPGVEPIVVSDRVNNANIQFDQNTKLVGYLGVFQGLTPVGGLSVAITVGQPNGGSVTMEYADDGTGKDSIAGDGIYTGFLPAHRFNGGGGSGKYFGMKIEISGEGVVPSKSGRTKRCVGCSSLGTITRAVSGNVIVVNNWRRLPDKTPPEKIVDLKVLNAAVDGNKVFTLGWTAPGGDLNEGQVASYEFVVGIHEMVENSTSLSAKAILTNTSSLIVNAGERLQIQVDISDINTAAFGVKEADSISTYYFWIRTSDALNNIAPWSNVVSASYIDPETLILPSPTTKPTVTAAGSINKSWLPLLVVSTVALQYWS